MNRASIAAVLLAIAPFAHAHKASDAYVTLHVDGATVAGPTSRHWRATTSA
jgi:hypothetical protein